MGQTIVLRAGTFHESVVVNKDVTIQSYPHEAAWLDGSSLVTGWARSGSSWKVGGWTTKFDSSPSYTRGSSGSTAAGWSFINPSYPMAAHPDQVEIELGDRKTAVTPQTLTGEERATAWQRITSERPNFAGYETKTDRQSPIVILERA